MKKVLVLGGTRFVGRQLVEGLSQLSQLDITLMHRGKTNPTLFPELKHIHADREQDDLSAITSQDWDSVIDFSCYYPLSLRRLLQGLSGRVGRYIFISTVSVYDMSVVAPGELICENSPLLSCSKEQEVDATMGSYGQRKVACEEAVLAHHDMNPLILRPGLIYGKYDPTDRFYYWLYRYKQMDQIVLPQVQAELLHWTYAPDFARLIIQALFTESLPRRIYQTLTHGPINFEDFSEALKLLYRRSPQLNVISNAEIKIRDLQYWLDIVSMSFERYFDRQTLKDFNLQVTPFEQTLEETSQYYQSLGWPVPKVGLKPAEELTLFQDLSREVGHRESGYSQQKQLIQSFVPLQYSDMWGLLRQFYHNQGIDAWGAQHIPYYYSNSPKMAHYYAQLILDFYHSSSNSSSQPLYILELGAGPGKLAYHITKILSKEIDDFKYIISDFVQKNLDFSLEHPKMKPLVKYLDIARFDVFSGQTLELQVSQETINVQELERPLIVIANYLFDSIPRNLYYVKYGQLYDIQMALYKQSTEIIRRFYFKPLQEYFGLEVAGIFSDYLKDLDGNFFTFPHGAIECLTRLKTLSKAGLFVISSDKAQLHLSDIQHTSEMPFLKDYGGGIALKVNYHALLKYFVAQGAMALVPEENSPFLTTVCFLDLKEPIGLDSMTLTFQDNVDGFYCQLAEISSQKSTLSYSECCQFLKNSDYDSYVLQELAPFLIEHLRAGIDGTSLPSLLEQIAAHHYAIEQPDRLNNTLGLLYFHLEQYERAGAYFEAALAEGFEVDKSQHNLQLCQSKLQSL